MQCFKLVNAGFVDKVIVFDQLPERFLAGVKTRDTAGFPRSWAKWLLDIGSTRPVLKTDTVMNHDRSYTYTHTQVGVEPCFYVLEYVDMNNDKQRWSEICEYLRLNVGSDVRLKEKIEEMAVKLANNSTEALAIEPEDIAVIPVPRETIVENKPHDIVPQGERIIVQEQAPKKRGRPKKVMVEA